MDPALLIPTPDTIPAPWGWFQFFLILTFFVHLIFMNAMIGSAAITLVRELRTPPHDPSACRDLANKLPYTIAFAVNFGVAPLLFLQVLYGHFIYTSSILMGAYWLSIIAIIIPAYYGAYIYKMGEGRLIAYRKPALAVSLVLMMLIGFLFVNNMTLMQRPAAWLQYFNQPNGTILNLDDPTLIIRYLHFMVASVAGGGLFLAILAFFQQRKGIIGAEARIKSGLKWFTYATVVEVGTGIPFLFTMPKEVHQLFVGGALGHTALFSAAMLTSFFAIYYGAKEKLWPTTVALGLTMLLMILVRDLARQAYLAPYFKPADLTVAPQLSPLYLFLLFLIIGVGVVIYMLKLAANAGKEVRP